MYHYVRPYSQEFPNFRFLNIENFKKQLDFFEREYGFVSRSEWLNLVEGECYSSSDLTSKKILLTFDDAMSCHYDYVFPELLKRGLFGIFYVPASPYIESKVLDVHRIHILCGACDGLSLLEIANDLIDETVIDQYKLEEFRERTYTQQDNYHGVTEFKRLLNYFVDYKFREAIIDEIQSIAKIPIGLTNFYVSENSLCEMSNSGMIIGSHSYSHPVMSRLDIYEQRNELEKSFAFLDSILTSSHRTYCHPYGGAHSFDQNTVELLNELNVSYSFSVEPREIIMKDFLEYRQSLPRFDCNLFPHGKAS